MPRKMCQLCRKQYDKYNMYATNKGFICEFCLIKNGLKPVNSFHMLGKKYGKHHKV